MSSEINEIRTKIKESVEELLNTDDQDIIYKLIELYEFNIELYYKKIKFTSWAAPINSNSPKAQIYNKQIEEFRNEIVKLRKKINGIKDGSIIPDEILKKRELSKLNSDEMEKYIEEQVQIQIEKSKLSSKEEEGITKKVR